MAINSRERIKYIHVIKLGSLQNKKTKPATGSSKGYSGGKNQAKTMKGNSNGTRFQ
ncbi:hypothetical protein KVC80_04125 [Helicobacter pylori]|nr:hypothetical protein KVC80_04125 [Helicobacter pylori]